MYYRIFRKLEGTEGLKSEHKDLILKLSKKKIKI